MNNDKKLLNDTNFKNKANQENNFHISNNIQKKDDFSRTKIYNSQTNKKTNTITSQKLKDNKENNIIKNDIIQKQNSEEKRYAHNYNKKNKFSKNLLSKIFIATLFFNESTHNTNTQGVEHFLNKNLEAQILNYNIKNNKIITEKTNNQVVLEKINNAEIPVLMFHKIGLPEDRYTISQENFSKILNLIHTKGYFLIGLNEFIKGDFSKVPVGKKPLLITFDDAGEGQLYFSEFQKPALNSAIGIMEKFKKENKDFNSKAVFFISYSDDKHNFREPFIEQGLSEKKIKFLHENGYDIGWHTPFHSNNTNATKKNIDEQTMILDALIFKSLGEKEYNNLVRSYAHPFGAKPKNQETLNYLLSKYDVVFDAWGGNSKHPLSKNFNLKSVPRIETHIHNIEQILNNKNNYELAKEDSIFYDRKFNKIINAEPKDLDSDWNYFINQKKQAGEL